MAAVTKYQVPLSTLLDEVLREFNNQEAGPGWAEFMQSAVLPCMDDVTQNHLQACPRCRFQSKIERRKATRGKEAPPLQVPTADQLMSLCEDGIAVITEAIQALIEQDLDKKFEEMTNKLETSRPSVDDKTFITNFCKTHKEKSLNNLAEVVETAKKWVTFFDEKEPLVKQVEEQEAMIATLKQCYTDQILVMAESARLKHAISNSKFYVIVPETFESIVNQKISTINAKFKDTLPDWEARVGRAFEIDGFRWCDLPDKTLLGGTTTELQLPIISADDSASNVSSNPARKSLTPVSTSKARPAVSPRVSPSPRPAVSARGSGTSTPTARTSSTATPPSKSKPQKLLSSAADKVADVDPGVLVVASEQRDTSRAAKFKVQPNDDSGPQVSIIRPSAENANSTIQVCIRIRPLVRHEMQSGHKAVIKPLADGSSIHITQALGTGKDKKHEMTFTTVCDGNTTQPGFFKKVNAAKLVDLAMEGFSTTCFAYGQTGSGKTFSMAGPVDVLGLRQSAKLAPDSTFPPVAQEAVNEMLALNLKLQGLMPQLANYLFDRITAEEQKDPRVRFELTASYVEIYNEQVQDLLTTVVKPLAVREYVDGSTGFYVEGVTKRPIETLDDMLNVFVEGTQNRMVTSHEMNSESSRSHAILSLELSKKVFDKDANTMWVTNGKISLVDLAGSESVKLTKTQGQSLQETAGINKSLLALSNIVSKLSEDGGTSDSQAGWRNSKLTMLLMDSLVGAGYTIMLACCSPSDRYIAETVSTLQFATKAANITKREVASLTPHELEVLHLKSQIDQLKLENELLKKALSDAGLPLPQLPEPESNSN